MIISSDVFEFIDKVMYFYKHISNNISEHFNSSTELITIKMANFIVNNTFIFLNIKIENVENNKLIEYINLNKFNKNIKDLFRPFFIILAKEKKQLLNKNKDDKYQDIYNYDDENIDFEIYINQVDEIDINYKYKYKIKSKVLIHDIELFTTQYTNFMSCVSKFHLPCVRAYYDGDNVYMLPSCIIAHQTYLNIDIKYFMANANIMDIINKYNNRGFDTLLNNKEIINIKKYNSFKEPWKTLFSEITFRDIYNKININSIIFKPRSLLYSDEDNQNIDMVNRYFNKSNDIINITNLNIARSEWLIEADCLIQQAFFKHKINSIKNNIFENIIILE